MARRHSAAAMTPKFGEAEPSAWVHTRDLIHHSADKFISLDESRSSAFSPSSQASFPAFPYLREQNHGGVPGWGVGNPTYDRGDGVVEHPQDARTGALTNAYAAAAAAAAQTHRRLNRLPNKRLDLDVRSLNLHLFLRVREVLACAETMWEWVMDYQKRTRAKFSAVGRSRSLQQQQPPHTGLDPVRARISRLTRRDFDELLRRFELCVAILINQPPPAKPTDGLYCPATCRTRPGCERPSRAALAGGRGLGRGPRSGVRSTRPVSGGGNTNARAPGYRRPRSDENSSPAGGTQQGRATAQILGPRPPRSCRAASATDPALRIALRAPATGARRGPRPSGEKPWTRPPSFSRTG
jgi:hypothetical protein